MICKKNKKCKTMAKAIFAFVLVFLLVIAVDWVEVWGYVVNAKWEYIILSVIFYFCGILISAHKWQILAQFKKFQQKYSFYFKTYLLGTFLNNFLPSFIGGDTYRIYALGKPEKRIGESSTTIIVDRISGLMSIIFLAIILAFINYEILMQYQIVMMFIIGISIFFVVFLGMIFFYDAIFVQKMLCKMPEVVQKYAQQLITFHSIKIMPKTMFWALVFDFVGIAFVNYMLFVAIGIELSFVNFLSVIFLTNIIASMPISVGNIGIKEWAYVFLFGIFSVSGSAAVTVVILARVSQMLVSLLAVPFYLKNKAILEHK
jgi:uncharacterized protein (TIRG00374 family)